MTPAQTRAVAYFKGFMERQLNTNPDYGDTLIEFTVSPTDYGTFWITARTDMTKLGEGNLLRALDRQHWLVGVGRKGSLCVKMAPKCFKQFNACRRKAFGMHFDIG